MLVLINIVALQAAGPVASEKINGMKLIAKEDRSVPLVAVVVLIRAGSAYEKPQESGLSHLLEHLVFDGTATRSRQVIKDSFDRMGGYVNAYTRQDYAAHEIVVPKRFLAEGIALQADMLLNSIVPEEELAKEKNVVIEEIRADLSHPSSVASEVFRNRFYAGGPYERPVLGAEETVSAVTREQVMEFYRRHYTPANMTAIVVGDFGSRVDLEKALSAAYGSHPPGEPVSRIGERQKREKTEAEFAQANIPHHYLYVAFPITADADDAAVALITALMSAEASPLQREIVLAEKPLARYLSAFVARHAAASAIEILALLTDEKAADKVLNAVLSEVRRLAEAGPGLGELARVKLEYTAGQVFSAERPLHLARELAHWEAVGDVDARDSLLKHVQAETPENVRKAAAALQDAPYLALLVGRSGKLEKPTELAPLQKVSDPAPPPDRRVTASPAASGRTEQYKVLDNGLTVIARWNQWADITATNVLVKDRAFLEPEGLEGIGDLTARMLDKGAGGKSAEEFSETLTAIAARLQLTDDPFLGFDDYYYSKNYSYVRIETLGGYYEAGLALLADMLGSASFPEARVEAAKQKILSQIRARQESSGAAARRRFFEMMFPSGPYRTPIPGTPESIERITREDVASYYRRAYAPSNLIVAVVGNRPPSMLVAEVERTLGKLPGRPKPEISARIQTGAGRSSLDVKSPQAALYAGYALEPELIASLPEMDVLTEILSDRLNATVREKLGLAYSVGADYELTARGGWLYAGLGTRAETLGQAREAVLAEFERLRTQPVTEEELAKIVNSIMGRRLRYRQSRINQAHFLCLYEFLTHEKAESGGWKRDEGMAALLAEVTPERIVSVAQKAMPADRLTVSDAGELVE